MREIGMIIEMYEFLCLPDCAKPFRGPVEPNPEDKLIHACHRQRFIDDRCSKGERAEKTRMGSFIPEIRLHCGAGSTNAVWQET